jgi:hypothetical protein
MQQKNGGFSLVLSVVENMDMCKEMIMAIE